MAQEKNILIVDDDVELGDLLAKAVGDMSDTYTVKVARNVDEAIRMVEQRVASAEDIDRIFVDCFGHKMGPLETADLIGLDTILDSVEVLHESYGDSKYTPCPLLREMVDAGYQGRKSGRGFYSYTM